MIPLTGSVGMDNRETESDSSHICRDSNLTEWALDEAYQLALRGELSGRLRDESGTNDQICAATKKLLAARVNRIRSLIAAL